jgi:beta-RFAP synthase
MIHVTTGSRLHFGLLHLPGGVGECWPNLHGELCLPARRFGGVGLMVDAPGIQLRVSHASKWSAEGPLAERALMLARRCADATEDCTCPCHLAVSCCAPEHRGLGTGTQLGLAIARALAAIAGEADPDAVTLAQRVGRGSRSALGIHGFAQGGFLIEAGQRGPRVLAPLAARVAFPENWRIVVCLPPCAPGLHGDLEQQAFAHLAPSALAWTDTLCRLVLLGMLPALIESDFPAFSEAVYDFNVRVGEVFAPLQGGTYADPRIKEIVRFVRAQNVAGVGQSSWGPAVFAVVEDEGKAQHLAHLLRGAFDLREKDVLVTRGRNAGATVREQDFSEAESFR